jgi:UDP-3-O-[3-hydroxymyristoyl] glucosamine N-acyltransferase
MDIHPSPTVAGNAEIGENTKTSHLVQVRPQAKNTVASIIGRGAFIGSHAVIVNRVKIQNDVSAGLCVV